MERLQKVLAHAGIASRRAAERLIREGRVVVNGEVVTEMGRRVDPTRDVVKVHGKRLPGRPIGNTYLMLHKPRGVVTTLADPEGRPTVRDFIPRGVGRLYPVGRLDFDSEGLLLLTNDGEMARDLMHPRSGVSKTYHAKVRGRPGPETLRALRTGVPVAGRPTLPARARVVRPGDNPWIEITVVEGRNRQVRRMLEAVGHPVVRLRRVAYGGLTLGALAPGAVRALDPREVERLRRRIRKGEGEPGFEEGPDRV